MKDRKKYFQEWYQENRERILSRQAKYYKENKEKVALQKRKWARKNRVSVYKYQRQWRERRRLQNLKKRSKRIYLKNNEYREYENRFGGNREKAIQRDKDKCVVCGLTRKKHKQLYGVDITVNHINQKGRNSDNPDHRLENLETPCLRCHGVKEHS